MCGCSSLHHRPTNRAFIHCSCQEQHGVQCLPKDTSAHTPHTVRDVGSQTSLTFCKHVLGGARIYPPTSGYRDDLSTPEPRLPIKQTGKVCPFFRTTQLLRKSPKREEGRRQRKLKLPLFHKHQNNSLKFLCRKKNELLIVDL